jgi:hypothetical protein
MILVSIVSRLSIASPMSARPGSAGLPSSRSTGPQRIDNLKRVDLLVPAIPASVCAARSKSSVTVSPSSAIAGWQRAPRGAPGSKDTVQRQERNVADRDGFGRHGASPRGDRSIAGNRRRELDRRSS